MGTIEKINRYEIWGVLSMKLHRFDIKYKKNLWINFNPPPQKKKKRKECINLHTGKTFLTYPKNL